MLVYKAEAVTQPPEWWAQGNDVGTGPYTVASYESGTRAILDYYPEYWGGWEEGQFTKIVYLIVEDPTVRDQMIRSGEVDVTSELPLRLDREPGGNERHDGVSLSAAGPAVVGLRPEQPAARQRRGTPRTRHELPL